MSKNLEFIVVAIGTINRIPAGINNKMEKVFSLLRIFVDVGGKSKFCVNYGNMATQEALFNVDGAMLIEKYSHYIISLIYRI